MGYLYQVNVTYNRMSLRIKIDKWGGGQGGRRRTGGGRRGGGKQEKKGKITQHCAIFRNRKNAKGREPKNRGREPGLKGTGSGRFKPPCPPPPDKCTLLKQKPHKKLVNRMVF